ncbi:DUF3578 domain-containing protein [Actinoplanes sp. NPDC089786]|uniref:MrcB family domain-containing protein n=1 Tax=Actinoplanes sp. NPDC089786 TaxID=3155185 RepID=UPI003414C591
MATAPTTLVDFLRGVGSGYSPRDGFDTPQQRLLSRAAELLDDYRPSEFVIKGSGGQGSTTDTPWVGFFDPDESNNPRRGLYVVWLLQATTNAWTLSVNMGTELRSEALKASDMAAKAAGATLSPREPRLLASFHAEAAAIRAGIPADAAAGWNSSMTLELAGLRQRRYEAATILAKTYPLNAMPDDKVLAGDLAQACVLLGEAIRVRDELASTAPGTVWTAPAVHVDPLDRDLPFEPGEDVETTIEQPKRSIKRKPRHEGGLKRYGLWLQTQGFALTTKVHPRDFVVTKPTQWIGEYKVVYGHTDVVRATREAHSQLKEYRHFLYPPGAGLGLLAVFSAPISDRRVAWLNAEGIAVVWDENDQWRGCPLARAAGLGL